MVVVVLAVAVLVVRQILYPRQILTIYLSYARQRLRPSATQPVRYPDLQVKGFRPSDTNYLSVQPPPPPPLRMGPPWGVVVVVVVVAVAVAVVALVVVVEVVVVVVVVAVAVPPVSTRPPRVSNLRPSGTPTWRLGVSARQTRQIQTIYLSTTPPPPGCAPPPVSNSARQLPHRGDRGYPADNNVACDRLRAIRQPQTRRRRKAERCPRCSRGRRRTGAVLIFTCSIELGASTRIAYFWRQLIASYEA